MNNLFLEEAVLDDLTKDLELMEMPLKESVFKLAGFFAVFIVAIVFIRILFLNVIKGDFYKDRGFINAAVVNHFASQRGLIFDRFGSPLVKNYPVYRPELKLVEFLKEGERKKILKILEDISGIDENELNNFIGEINLENQDSLSLPINFNEEEVKKIKALNLKSLYIKTDYKRKYLFPEIFSHIIGYTGYAENKDVKNNNAISLNDIIGKSGLENYYDFDLRGADGKIIYYRNAKGEIIDDKFLQNAISGADIETTIDKDLQNYFYQALHRKLSEIGSNSGTGIALNPQNGEILSLISIPGFNANEIKKTSLNNSSKPFFNRAISGLYSPGSTIKPLVAFAALKEKIIDSETKIFSRGYIEIPNPYFPDQPSRFLDWKPQGWVDLSAALAKSSNVYFYALGGGLPKNELPLLDGQKYINGLGIKKLKDYWAEFGLGEKTKIDLPFEMNGFLPDQENKENKGEIWRLGDTYNVSIGQGDLMITPIELLNYISAIAEKGKFYRPFIVKKIISNNGEIKEIKPEILRDLSQNADYFKEVEKGMVDVVAKPYGTAKLLSDIPMKIAAKTGSAQINFNTKVNAFFVGYAPVNPPVGGSQIAILVLIEDAKEGSLNAVPVAKEVLEWYYYNRIDKSL
ncbi:hypothetical protein HZB04_03175 [Candidatus Wolfebacteria bacterium]|nr:hypothetical protein [Candidatus Wolfebacteria bacterium]